jgi:CHAT domain-containing protein/tetratricopeptide (TPR) repeat protein
MRWITHDLRTFARTTFLILFAISCVTSLCMATGELRVKRTEEVNTQEDRKRLAAAAIVEGKQFESQGNADDLRKALDRYEKAHALLLSLNDRPGTATALGHIGTVHHLLGERQKALDAFQQQLQLWRAERERPREIAEALHNIGTVYSSMGMAAKAIEFYEEALPLRRTAGDRAGLATTLDNLGLAHLYAGEMQKASDYSNQALTLFRELNDRKGLANALNNIGGINLTLGDFRKALEYFGQALELRRALGHRPEESIALNNIGRVHDLLGEAQKALDYHRQALQIRRELGDRLMEAASLNNIGLVYDWLGAKDKALDHYKQALELFRAANDRNLEATALNNIGGFYLNTLKDSKPALDYYTRSLEIRRMLGQPIDLAIMLDNIGHLHNSSGDPRKALEYHDQALKIRQKSGHRLGEAASLSNMGAAHYALGELSTAFDYYNQALKLFRSLGHRSREAVALYGLAMIERDRGNLDESLLLMEASLKIVEWLRSGVASQPLRASYLAQKQNYYEFHIDLLMRLHQREPAKAHDLAAFQASERARARSLLELLEEARIDVEQGISPELKQRERVAHLRIARIQSQLIQAYSQALPDRSRTAVLEEELKQADAEREQLRAEIRQRHPPYAELQYPAAPELKDVQSLLGDQTVLLEYALGQQTSFLFAVTRKDFLVVPLPPASALGAEVEALRAVITSRPQRSDFEKQIKHSRKLFRDLLEPAGKLLVGKQKLIIVSSGILHYLPFEVLLTKGEDKALATMTAARLPYLLRDYAISYVPSAAVLASLRNRPAKSTVGNSFLAFADPVYGDLTESPPGLTQPNVSDAFGDQRPWRLGRLIETRREVEQISALFPKDQVSLLLREQASEENAKTAGRFNQFRFVHFATHGLLNEENPSHSGLILNLESKQSEDGLLQAYEIFNLKLNADLVVLSGCETGLGRDVKGEGLVGLSHAFFYAGTPSLVVSLWKVQDRSTADLMVNLYREIGRTQTKAEALRQAKLRLIQQGRYADPHYWAPFVLTGDPE